MLTLSLEQVPVLAVFVPFLGAFLAYMAGRWSERLRDWLVVIFSGIAFILVALLFPVIAAGEKLYYAPEIGFLFYPPVFAVDGLSYALALATSFVWLVPWNDHSPDPAGRCARFTSIGRSFERSRGNTTRRSHHS